MADRILLLAYNALYKNILFALLPFFFILFVSSSFCFAALFTISSMPSHVCFCQEKMLHIHFFCSVSVAVVHGFYLLRRIMKEKNLMQCVFRTDIVYKFSFCSTIRSHCQHHVRSQYFHVTSCTEMIKFRQ